jgi:hypothetical protein
MIRTEKLASSTRYFQQLALMVTVVWGGFGLFATQLKPESDLAVFAMSVASPVAVLFAFYWMISAARYRYDEMAMDHRLRQLERTLNLSWSADRDTEPRPELHPLVRLFAIHTGFPLSMVVIGVGGAAMWTVLLVATWLIHFEVV